ncbi:hypothetical protein KIH39_25915 [Telmatocola sphagniphila]|uniref:Uncharacterized protein n=1 Tax=Telmatocola sphagniphila TaxID=1123043 RepID=A0A8E6EV42_9BACT|nr:hypothetical protein [Telmatocola sphagniphila]QVL32230.1 hypothetical protein KIH39_25915 [Telmatocola sphagniphila]
MWSRIFGLSDAEPAPAGLLEHLQQSGLSVRGQFRGDDLGWTAAELSVGTGTPVYLERYLVKEDNLREDLNVWAGILETCDYSPFAQVLMEKVIQSKQMITLRKPIDHNNESQLEDLLDWTCRWLAQATEGIYQVDGAGWFDANGMRLIEEY